MAVKNLEMLEGVIIDEKEELEGHKYQCCQDQVGGREISLEELVNTQKLDDQEDETCHEDMGQEAGHKGTDMPAKKIDNQGQEAKAEGIKEDDQRARPNQGQKG